MNLTEKDILQFIGAIALACFSGYIGFRAGIKSKKREEWNEAADSVRSHVRNNLKNMSNQSVHTIFICESEFEKLLDRCGFWEKKKLQRSISQYEAAKKENMFLDSGEFKISNEEPIRVGLENILRCVQRK